MFTGIVSDIGILRAISGEGTVRAVIATTYDTASIAIGASIAHDGICLTVTEKGTDWYAVDLSPTTLEITTAGEWKIGTRVNLERALKVGDELGGHLVSGHVDGVVEVLSREDDAESSRFTISCPKTFAPFIATKGSVVLNGTSLTVTEVGPDRFGLTLIPHTLAVTTWGTVQPGDRLNLEVDMLARYLMRIYETRA